MNGPTFQLLCYCAREDQPYHLSFERQPNGRYRCAGSVQVHSGKRGTGAIVTTPASLRLDQIDGGTSFCAWCGSGGINHCTSGSNGCDSFVCGGRKQGRLFICRDSCGARWEGIPLEALEGETVQECLMAPRSVPVNCRPAERPG